MREKIVFTATCNGTEYPLVKEYSRYHGCNVPRIGWFTTYSFAEFLRLIHEYSTFPYILCGVHIITYHTSNPATLMNKIYDYRVQFYRMDVEGNKQFKLMI